MRKSLKTSRFLPFLQARSRNSDEQSSLPSKPSRGTLFALASPPIAQPAQHVGADPTKGRQVRDPSLRTAPSLRGFAGWLRLAQVPQVSPIHLLKQTHSLWPFPLAHLLPTPAWLVG